MSPVTFYLTRHGRTAWNALGRFQGHTDIALDEVGRGQALALAESLRGKVQAIFSSNLARASETASIVATVLDVPVLALDADLRERGYGVFEGLTWDECKLRFPDAWAAREQNRNHEPPGGESSALVLARMQRALQRAVTTLDGRYQDALVISHGSSLRMFLETLSDQPVTSIANMETRQVTYDRAGFRLG